MAFQCSNKYIIVQNININHFMFIISAFLAFCLVFCCSALFIKPFYYFYSIILLMKDLFEKLMQRRLFRELFLLFKYGLVGIINTCITTGIFLLLSYLGLEYVLYTIIGYAVGICISFLLNRKYTFKKENENATRQIILFFTISVSLLAIVQLIQYLLIDIYNLQEWLGVGIGMVFYTGTGFILNRNIVFKYTDKSEE